MADDLRTRIDAALQESMDRCARCKTCDVQVDAVMAVIAGLVQPPGRIVTHWGARYPGEPGVREYDDEEDARRHLGTGEVVVSCEVTVGPWTEAPEPEEEQASGVTR